VTEKIAESGSWPDGAQVKKAAEHSSGQRQSGKAVGLGPTRVGARLWATEVGLS
jgi:hypothetical protein